VGSTDDADDNSVEEFVALSNDMKKKLKKGTGQAKATSAKAAAGKGAASAVVYIGHIPHGFYEDQMKGFFGQFGEVKRLRLSRSTKTGWWEGWWVACTSDCPCPYVLHSKPQLT
jgi:nucleolar protein 15